MVRDPDVLVLGAGVAGLGAACALQRAGARVAVLERAEHVGASWRDRYDGLRLNTVGWLSHAPHRRLPRAAGRWVARDELVRYLDDYTAQERLDVRTGVEVTRVDRDVTGWIVRTTGNGDLRAKQVVVALGHDRVPWMPEWPGRDAFAGRLLHSSSYRNARPFEGHDVLVVGSGNSAGDIATELARDGAANVSLAVRTPPNVQPGELFGLPCQPVALVNRVLPDVAVDAIARGMSRVAFGDLSAHGLMRPPGVQTNFRRTGRTPIVDRGFVEQLRRGRIRIVAAVEGLAGHSVHLADGSCARPDVVIACTGFRPGLEPIVGHLGVLDETGQPCVTGGRDNPAARGLRFVGYVTPLHGAMVEMRTEARRVARAVA